MDSMDSMDARMRVTSRVTSRVNGGHHGIGLLHGVNPIPSSGAVSGRVRAIGRTARF
jgi:hypothetical protein